ncbi:putative leader peptide [Spirillospora sp. NPDC049652]
MEHINRTLRLNFLVRFSEKKIWLVARLHVDLCRLASVLCHG